jgi:hypothetical protein
MDIHNLFVPQDKNNAGVIYTRKTEKGEGKKDESFTYWQVKLSFV